MIKRNINCPKWPLLWPSSFILQLNFSCHFLQVAVHGEQDDKRRKSENAFRSTPSLFSPYSVPCFHLSSPCSPLGFSFILSPNFILFLQQTLLFSLIISSVWKQRTLFCSICRITSYNLFCFLRWRYHHSQCNLAPLKPPHLTSKRNEIFTVKIRETCWFSKFYFITNSMYL